jgi:DNA repair protein RecN (Recombination protein N)
MLTEIRITDFAIIDQLTLTFNAGLITFTGETGAGKSIIIDAVDVVLGGRVDAAMIRSGSDRALVEGDFRIPQPVRAPIHALLQREELLDDPDSVTLGREIRREGRNLARVNGRNVNLAILKEIGEYLVDVHGQSEHLSLLRVREHLHLLDRYAGAHTPLAAYHDTYTRLRAVQRALNDLRASERDAARRADLLQYQIDEIEAAGLEPGEDEELRRERTRLANAESLASLAQEALFLMDESEPETQSATDLIGQALTALNNLARTDPSRHELAGRMQEIFDSLADISLELRDYMETIEYNPKRLEEVEIRLDQINTLKRKYGATIEEILAFGRRAAAELDTITHAEARLAALSAEENSLLAKLAEQGETLHAARRKAAGKLAKEIERELKDLRMEQAKFDVEFERRADPDGVALPSGERVAYGPQGLDAVQFLVAPNPGEGLKPLAKIASGGEMSRLMLALKNVLAQADTTPTLIFDEIDQGIGGRIGGVVGEKLWRLAGSHQVLCITHLPQLAAFGGQHYRVIKHVEQGRTSTRVEALSGEARIAELAQMLGEVSDGTLQSAREILQGAVKSREQGAGSRE